MKNHKAKKTWTAALAASMLTGFASSSLAQSTEAPVIPSPPAAYSEALASFDAAWDQADLSFATATFTSGKSQGYGRYTPRSGNDFAADEAISVYAEPVGYSFAETSEGFSYQLDASFRLLNLSGQVLAEETGFARFSGAGRTKQRELSASLTFQFGGLPAGDYILETTFIDANNGQSAPLSLPFSVLSAE